MGLLEEDVATLKADSTNFKRWQKQQDEAIVEVKESVATTDKKYDAKFDKLLFLAIAQLCLLVVNMAMKGH